MPFILLNLCFSDGLASFYDKIFEEKIEQRYEELERQSNPGSTKIMRRRTPSVGRSVGKLDLTRSVEFERNRESSGKLTRSNSLRNSASKSPGISSRASFFQDAITSKVKGQSSKDKPRCPKNLKFCFFELCKATRSRATTGDWKMHLKRTKSSTDGLVVFPSKKSSNLGDGSTKQPLESVKRPRKASFLGERGGITVLL